MTPDEHPRHQAIEKAKNGQAFPLDSPPPIFLWTRRPQVLQGMSVTFHANIRISDLSMFNIK